MVIQLGLENNPASCEETFICTTTISWQQIKIVVYIGFYCSTSSYTKDLEGKADLHTTQSVFLDKAFN